MALLTKATLILFFQIKEMAVNIQKYYLKKNRCYKNGVKRVPIGIQIHTIGCAQGTAKAVADYWNQSSVSAAVTYICDADVPGNVLNTLPEDYYTWADAGYGNRNLITIEVCESDFMKYGGRSDFTVTDEKLFEKDILRGYDTAVELCVDICRRYGWNPIAKLPSGLYLISSHDEGRAAGLSSAHVDPSHLWPRFGLSMDTFRRAVANGLADGVIVVSTEEAIRWYRVRKSWTDASSQLGAYEVVENAKENCPYGYSIFDADGKIIFANDTKPKYGTQAVEFEGLSESVAAEKILGIVHECDKSGILTSVTAAQFILESGYGKTRLCKVANNCFGMKASLSGNTWDGSSWDGVSKVTLPTHENYNGKDVVINADFRKYPDIESSIRDHSAYLLGAMNGNYKRYDGLLDAVHYIDAITIIKTGGYATDPDYISKICNIIQRFDLDRYDKNAPKKPTNKRVVYRVQLGLYTLKSNAVKRATQVNAKTDYETGVEKVGLKWQATCGSFDSETRAHARESMLKNAFNIDCCVKEVEIKN